MKALTWIAAGVLFAVIIFIVILAPRFFAFIRELTAFFKKFIK